MNIVFKKLLEKYSTTLERNLIKRLKRANDKEHVVDEFRKAMEFLEACNKSDKNRQKVAEIFMLFYKRGEDMNYTLEHLRKVFGHEIEEIKSYKKIVDGEEQDVYITEEEKALKQFTLNDRKFIKFLIRLIAFQNIQKKIDKIYQESVSDNDRNPKSIENIVKWTGSKEDNKNEFVQLVYGLHKAGFLNKGKGEITKIVESLSEVFGIDLGKNWQSNHSASIHKAKHNYEPPIFQKVKNAYQEYTEKLIEEKKKNK